MSIHHVFAATAGILLIVVTPPSFSLDRLFTTQAERIRLDTIRSGADPTPEIPESNVSRDTVTVNGVFLRKSGKNTAWINGDSTDSRSSAKNTLHKPGRISYSGVTMTIEELSPGISLRPGQVFLIKNREIKESYELGLAHRAVPASDTLEKVVNTETHNQAGEFPGG